MLCGVAGGTVAISCKLDSKSKLLDKRFACDWPVTGACDVAAAAFVEFGTIEEIGLTVFVGLNSGG